MSTRIIIFVNKVKVRGNLLIAEGINLVKRRINISRAKKVTRFELDLIKDTDKLVFK